MRDRTPWLKLLGGVWFVLGVVGFLWSISSLLSVPPERLISWPSGLRALQVFSLPPWSQITGMMGALFAIVAGWALVRRQKWAQMILVAAHLLLIVYAAVGAVIVYVASDHTSLQWIASLAILGVVMLLNGVLAFFMSDIASTEALSWLPLRTLVAAPEVCEFCGSTLDPETHLCPQCQSVPSLIHAYVKKEPPRAKLVSLTDEAEYWLDPGSRVSIGRGASGNDINLSNPTVSRFHAQIEFDNGHYALTALQDSNGTFINDTLVRHRTLQDGDEVRFGRSRFRFVVVEPERSEPS
jgi:hypothetical protein